MTWNTTDPELTSCFQQTVLIWTPCAFLWFFALLELYYIKNSKDKNIPWSFLNISKLCLNGFIIILTIVDLGMAVSEQDVEAIYPVHIYTPLIKIFSFVRFTENLIFVN